MNKSEILIYERGGDRSRINPYREDLNYLYDDFRLERHLPIETTTLYDKLDEYSVLHLLIDGRCPIGFGLSTAIPISGQIGCGEFWLNAGFIKSEARLQGNWRKLFTARENYALTHQAQRIVAYVANPNLVEPMRARGYVSGLGTNLMVKELQPKKSGLLGRFRR